ncbi:helix-turn-helix domain-containing protein [Lysobacter silvisoli]|uniref:XRE family transcriptional regulator n=1 Tax=Lysobacter silvisoli TaxID=2293254 RepID=A0A371JXP0_9GAMM|nr:XRE family transcriptional regulator [Lysobacter silvisoli]RDZ26372.1 XRE family transcriptional regulator [Lysobacter silvisoli]
MTANTRSARPKRVAAADASALPAQPGDTLRALRARRGWTLAELSERTGLPISTLSKVENNRMSLTYDKLSRISRGLEVDIADLFGSPAQASAKQEPTGRRSITRAGEGYALESANYGHLFPAAELRQKRFTPIVAEVRARSIKEFGELVRHTGEEFALVLEGTLELHSDLYAPARLEVGDSIYFDSSMGHAYINAGDGPCRVLSVCTEAEAPFAVQAPAARKRNN